MYENDEDAFLTRVYDSLHDSAMQRKLRRIRPIPFGVVFLPYPGVTEQQVREHLRTIRRLGFNCIKQFMATPQWSITRLRELALEEGLIPWTYGEGGWEEPDNDLLSRLGLPQDMAIGDVRQNRIFLDHQHQLMEDRIRREALLDNEDVSRADVRKLGRGSSDGSPKTLAETAHSAGPGIPPDHRRLYVEWLSRRYTSIKELNEAWNVDHVGIGPARFSDWPDLEARFEEINQREYRHILDELRFKADSALARICVDRDHQRAADPNAPMRAGGEIGLFLPFAWWGVDMEEIANSMTDAGSFYPSLHLAWHFEETSYEFVRPAYMQASYTADLFKGGWAATWESTGGPQQFSGGKGPTSDPEAPVSAFTVHEGTMTQLLLSYLAGGLRGVGLWTWNARTAGWEAGEYALMDRNLQVTPRAIRSGQIAQAAERYRDELWDARKEPLVGIFQDWDNEAIWTAISTSNRDQFKLWPIRARIGASRALINGNVPFEYVTANNLRRGLAGRYRSIYLPAVAGLSLDLMPILRAYVEAGGRLIMDAPGAWLDTYGRVPPTGVGSEFETLFGATLDDFQYGSNVRYSHQDQALDSFVSTVTPTRGTVARRRDDGAPLVVENSLGKGTAVLVATGLSLMLWKPGNLWAEALLTEIALGGRVPPYRCDGAIAYRLAAPMADHYFLINDGPATVASLSFDSLRYISAIDAVTGESIQDAHNIPVESDGGRWIRCQKH
jgi:beta-galactosidase